MAMRGGWRSTLFACLAAVCGWANATGLQVAPTTLSLRASQNADGLTLSNTGDDVIHAQVRVYHWRQDGSGDQLTPSPGLVISPPMVQIPAGGEQLIRVIRTGAPPNGPGAVEDAYRLAIDELPVDAKSGAGLRFVVHYSLPIFIEPAGAADTSPQLKYELEQSGQLVSLKVTNKGNGHGQLAALSFVDAAGQRTELVPGLLGYVLPGSTMHWALKPPANVFAKGGTLEVMVNGQKTTENLSLAGHSP
ncbi:fimbrial biogenesis chaperone [Dyella soli]|nr:molecular chaperone [Dyella soli]